MVHDPCDWTGLIRACDELRKFIIGCEKEWTQDDWVYRGMLLKVRMLSNQAKHEIDQLRRAAEEFWATHWRDDDSPQHERTFGVCRAA
jgi:hypothetical protein